MRSNDQNRRRTRCLSAPERLTAAGIDFEMHNDGTHFIVDRRAGLVDFWPSRGIWIDRHTKSRRGNKKRGHGIDSLIAWVQKCRETLA